MKGTTSKTTASKATKPKKVISKPDLLWKDLFTEFHSEAVLFFLGKRQHNAIDFTHPPVYLEQEFNETFAATEPIKKIADKIVRYKLKNGKFRYLIIHVEFQGKAERHFAERMFRYFVHIYIKYGGRDITALAIYTGASRPQTYDTFIMSGFGTKITYKFNTYTVRDQTEAKLLKSDNPIAIAVLASLFLIKAGQDPTQKLAYKKNLIEITRKKNFDRAKLYRLFNFVQYLIRLPPKFEQEYKQFIAQPKNEEKMEYSRDFLEIYASREIKAIREEEREAAREAVREAALEERKKEREKNIMNLYDKMGLTAKQIADVHDFTIKYVQSVIDKFEEERKKKNNK